MEKKRTKIKIGVGYVLKARIVEMEEKIREGRTRRMRIELVVCVQYVVGKNKFLV